MFKFSEIISMQSAENLLLAQGAVQINDFWMADEEIDPIEALEEQHNGSIHDDICFLCGGNIHKCDCWEV